MSGVRAFENTRLFPAPWDDSRKQVYPYPKIFLKKQRDSQYIFDMLVYYVSDHLVIVTAVVYAIAPIPRHINATSPVFEYLFPATPFQCR